MLTSITVYACNTVKIKKKFQTRGHSPAALVLDPPFTWQERGGIKEWDIGAEDSNDYNWIN